MGGPSDENPSARSGRRAILAGGGRYRFNGRSYTELIDYHFDPSLVGRSIQFDCRLQDDRWYHSGELEVQGVPSVLNEVWRRVE